MKDAILKILKDASGYVSGESISRELGVSRTAVWKNINLLRRDGYIIDSVTNRGYRLSPESDILREAEIAAGLDTEFIGRNIVFSVQTKSTNEDAKNSGAAASDGAVFAADSQTGGRGRLGRGWASPPGTGIFMSILLRPELYPEDVSKITLAAGLAVCRALRAFDVEAKIKWPNDIVLNAKKICGILTEMSCEMERVNYVVCGIGLNVNTESFESDIARKATSLYIETGRKFKRRDIMQGILHEFERVYRQFLESGLEAFLDEYKSLCITLGQDVTVRFKDREISAYAADISKSGALLIEHDGQVSAVNSGEVSVRGIYGYI